jgi:hypothetical protein
MIFKSAVAFFFLFFLHGFSIGNGQQGISYNGSRIREGCEALALRGRAALLYTMLPPVLLTNLT